MTRRLALCVAFVGVAVCLVRAQKPMTNVDPGWVGLYSHDMVAWLENENQLQKLCPGNASEASRCREATMAPKLLVINLYSGPDPKAGSRGSILVQATPGVGLRFFFVRMTGGAPVEFEADFTVRDWGYGPFFHQTYLDRRGDWFQLPEDPFPQGTWFNARDLGGDPDIRLVEGIVESPQGHLLILGREEGIIRARLEQPADMWCDSDPAPPLTPWKELRIPTAEFYDAKGHLIVSPAYPKGCL